MALADFDAYLLADVFMVIYFSRGAAFVSPVVDPPFYRAWKLCIFCLHSLERSSVKYSFAYPHFPFLSFPAKKKKKNVLPEKLCATALSLLPHSF